MALLSMSNISRSAGLMVSMRPSSSSTMSPSCMAATMPAARSRSLRSSSSASSRPAELLPRLGGQLLGLPFGARPPRRGRR
jgi:hypothetical protein